MLPIENPLAGQFDHLGFIEIYDWLYCLSEFEPGFTPVEACMNAHLKKGLTRVAFSVGRSTVYYHSKNPLITQSGELTDFSKPDAELNENYIRSYNILQQECCFESALSFARKNDMTVYAHLSMARNYSGYGNIFTSKLSLDENNLEVGKNGEKDFSRMCYALRAVRDERKAIIKEVLEMGADGICLDFVRQPPMAQYHPVMVQEFLNKTGIDPLKINLKNNPEQFKAWIEFRAGYLTGFMEEVHTLVRELELRTGRRLEIIARLPDDGFTANMVAGIHIADWCERGLVDTIAVQPLQWIHGIWQHDAAPYVDLGRLTGVKVFGGVNMYPVERGFGQNPVAIAQRILDQYEKGVAGISIYETNDSVLRPELDRLLSVIDNIDDLRALLADREWVEQYPIDGLNVNCGMDNHSGFSRTPLMDL